MEKYFTKFRRSLRPLVYGAAALAAVAIPTVANADSYIDVDGFRYRLSINPHAGVGEYLAVSAVLVGALSHEAATGWVNLPDYVYADGVQYPVFGIDAAAYEGYYGIRKIAYNKFCYPKYGDAGAAYVTDIRLNGGNDILGDLRHFTELHSVDCDYALGTIPSCFPGYDGVCQERELVLANISLPAFHTEFDVNERLGYKLESINLGFSMNRVGFELDNSPFFHTIRCAAPVPPEVNHCSFNEASIVTVHVPVGSGAAYREDETWRNFIICEDMDYAYNPIDTYVEANGLYYGMVWDEDANELCATVIGPVDRNCTSVDVMQSVDFGWEWQSVPVKKISPCAFMDCKNITSFYLPEGLEEIGDMAFYGCPSEIRTDDYSTAIIRIYLPNSIKKIGRKAFAAGPKVYHYMPESLRRIEDYAFSGALPNYYISQYQSYQCVILNDGLEYIGDYAFEWNNFPSVFIPSTVSFIGCNAFDLAPGSRRYCGIEFSGDGIIGYGNAYPFYNPYTELTIPSSVTTIQYQSVAAKSIIVGENVRHILPRAMYGVEELWMLPDTPPMAYDTSFGESPADKTLHVKKGCLNRYAADPVWGTFGNIVEDIDWVEVTQGDWRFKVDRFNNTAEVTGYDGDKYSVTALAIPAEVSLDGVAYPVETLGKFAISNIRSDCSIEIPASIKRIRNYAITYSSPEKVVCKSPEPPAVDTKFPYAVRWPYNMEDMYYNAFTLCVPKGSVEAYKASDFGKMFREVVEELPTEIDGPLSDDVCGQSLPAEVYSIGGELLYKGILGDAHLPAGIYIVKQGEKAKKYIVR